MRVAVQVDDIGAEAEDDEPLDAQRLGIVLRILIAEVMNVYEASVHSAQDGSDQ